MTEQPDQLTVVRNEARGRYELWSANVLAGFSEIREHGDRITFMHTEIDDAFGGRGYGKILAAGALDDAVSRGKTIVPLCPFIDSYLRKHPEYEGHVHRPGGGS